MSDPILITGLNGTVAPVAAGALQRSGYETTGWDRSAVAETDLDGSLRHLENLQPQAIYHIGLGPPAWAATLAGWCRDNQRRFVFTSTVSVFAGNAGRPYTIGDQPDATDDYGRYKQACEQAIAKANDDAVIARLGWQIGDRAGSNNMLDYLEQNAADGQLELSKNWLPACSFLEDTAAALVALEHSDETGLFHLDGNPGLSMFEIGKRLSALHDDRWQIRVIDEPRYDNLMQDDRVAVAPITQRLGGPG